MLLGRWSWLVSLAVLLGCERPRVADPGVVLGVYADALKRGDSARIYALLSERSRRELGQDGTRRLVADERRELSMQAEFFARPGVRPEAAAVIRYDDGEEAGLALEAGRFRVSSAAALPASARTPAEALSGLRKALARRSYAGLVRVLTGETRSALETDIAAIVDGLEDPESLEVDVEGDDAEVGLPSGHSVRLKREAGVWRIEDVK